MKVLHLLQSNRFSGAENVVCQIISMFKGETDVEMVYCSRDGQIRQALEEQNINFIPIDSLSFKEVKKAITEFKPDIVHAHDMRASFVAARACGKIPLISHIHNNNFDSRGLSVKSIAYMFAAMKSKHIFWVSQSSFNGYAFHNLFSKKSTVLYNIIDIDALYQKMDIDSNTYDYDAVYVGRLTFQKNPQRLMRVFKLVKDKIPNVRFAVIGTGDLEAETKALASEYDLLNNVSFLGFQSNPLKMLYGSKVMVMTSRWEGTPMCALEAMALGVPIVSTPVDGLKDLITNGENGYLDGDDEDIAQRIIDIITDSLLYEKLSENTKQYAKKANAVEPYKAVISESYRNAIRDER